MKKIIMTVVYILYLLVTESMTETISNIGPTNKQLILKNQIKSTKEGFFGILLVPYIICFFAATGIWPRFPQSMQSSVNEMGQQVFSQSDEQIRNFCKGKFALHSQQSYGPILFKGIFLPIPNPAEQLTTSTVVKTTIQEQLRSSTTAITEAITETTTTEADTTTESTTPTTTTEASTTTDATTTSEATTTTEASTTTEATSTTVATTASTTETDVEVITFDPNVTPLTVCNCSYAEIEKLERSKINATIVKVKDNNKTLSQSSTTAYPGNIKIEIKNVISVSDLILSFLNITKLKP